MIYHKDGQNIKAHNKTYWMTTHPVVVKLIKSVIKKWNGYATIVTLPRRNNAPSSVATVTSDLLIRYLNLNPYVESFKAAL